MTGIPATQPPAQPATPPAGQPAAPAGQVKARGRRAGRWRNRWYRAVVPFAVLALLAGITTVARMVEEPSLRQGDTLSPAGTGRDGSSELAQLLTARGVRIEHVSDIEQALDAMATGEDSVVFIPKPTIFGGLFAGEVPYLPGEHRVVMVAPSPLILGFAGARGVGVGQSRWATRAVAPGCAVPAALEAGTAGALRSRYYVEDPDLLCYQGGLVRAEVGFAYASTELYLVGSTDPFRNRRIGEHGNATLAVELLSAHDRVIWLDALPFDVDFQMPQLNRPRIPELEPPSRGELDRSRDGWFQDLVAGYPSQVPVGLSLAALLALLVALVRGRRLGGPVSEPLPVLVPAAEAVAGRGRLYQRARGRGAALEALRASALRRLVPAVGLPSAPPPEPDTVVAAVAARARLPEAQVRYTLYGPEPDTDEQLSHAVAALDALVQSVTREGGTP